MEVPVPWQRAPPRPEHGPQSATRQTASDHGGTGHKDPRPVPNILGDQTAPDAKQLLDETETKTYFRPLPRDPPLGGASGNDHATGHVE